MIHTAGTSFPWTAVKPTKMRPKHDTTRNSQSDSGSITDLTINDLRRLIREEVKSTIKDEVDTLSARLGNKEQQMQILTDLKDTVNAVETSITHTSERIDDIFRNSLPALARHINEVATGLALQTMDLDVHRRKWTLTIHGLKGEAGEDEEVTRDACVKLAQDHLGIPNAASTDFAACHRLSKHASSGIIMRFRDLSTRNTWLGNAKELRHHSDTISISPDLPPALRPMKKELLAKRKDMPQAQRSKYNLRYLRQWPYVVLSGPEKFTIVPSVSKEAIVENIIGLSPTV